MMWRRLVLITVVMAVAIVGTVYAAYQAGVIQIGGVFEPAIKVDPSRITLDLGRVTDVEGSRTFSNIAKITVNNDGAKIKFRLDENQSYVTGNLKLDINGRIKMGDKIIQLPCIFTNSGSCARIAMIIPGFDVPMEIPKGEYPLDVTLAWNGVEGSGSITLAIIVESS